VRRFPYIDALRGWAILLVLLDHAAQGSFPIRALVRFDPSDQPDLILPNWLRTICQSGTDGVVLFFTLSAISLTLSAQASGQFQPGRYFLRRFLRVAPMYYFGVALYLILYGWGPRWSAPSGITTADVAENLLFVHGFFAHAINSVVPGGWSVATEAIFYVLLPFLFAMTKAIRLVVAFCVALALSYLANPFGVFAYTNLGFAHYHFVNYLPAIAIGAATAISLGGKPVAEPTAREKNLRPLILLLLLILVVPFANVGPFELALHVILTATLGAGLCRAFHETGAVNAFVVNRGLARIGTVSFSMYIVHFALLSTAFALTARVVHSRGILFMAGDFLVLTTLAFAVSNVTYELIEAPFIRLARRMTASARRPSTDQGLSFHATLSE
jgi:peptidoglycan/LPS O-acetylase OafA/YrhL